MGVGLGGADRAVVPGQRGPPGSAEQQAGGVRPEGWSTAAARRGDGRASETGIGPAGVAPGPKGSVDELARALGRADGVRGAPGSADGQQHGGAGATRPGGVAKEQLRIGSGVGGQTGGDAVQRVSNAVLGGYQPAGVADGIPAGVRQSGRASTSGPEPVP